MTTTTTTPHAWTQPGRGKVIDGADPKACDHCGQPKDAPIHPQPTEQHLADARRVHRASHSETARGYVVGLPVCMWVEDDGTVTYDVDTSEAGKAMWEDTTGFGDQEEPMRSDEQIKADQDRVDADHAARWAAAQAVAFPATA